MSMIMQSGVNIAKMVSVELSSICSVQVKSDAVQMPYPRYGWSYPPAEHPRMPPWGATCPEQGHYP